MSTRHAATRLLARAGSSRQTLAPIASRAASTSTSTPTASSSSSSSSSWQPALPAGTSPAYDAALSYLSYHQSTTLSKLDKQRSKLDANNPDPDLLQRIDQLEVEAYSNDPAIRRSFRETGGKGQMGQMIFRWLSEEKWKKQGGLDLLMQRLLQMNVVPDLLPTLPPTSPLTITLNQVIEPGSIQLSSLFSNPPIIHSQLFHHPSLPTTTQPNPEALHTLLVIDPDSPSHETHSFQQRVHFLKRDIPLSVLSGEVNLADTAVGKEVLGWESPAPEQGTPNHRYVFLLFRQTQSQSFSSVSSRENVDLREYLSENNLVVDDLVGINMFRSKWSLEENEFINNVYVNQRGVEGGAPVYGKVPKQVRYGYPMSAKRQRIEEAREDAWNHAVAELKGLVHDVEGLAGSTGEAEKVKV
ncbi:hypothetical protein I203_103164 [Kwoniella mangroviensis CBS 8507]|uniref:uncharacterized protein n=1 Tax=Kwoniella mangroviensis CBS 8507 TaxID=1296122 RepID=UPI00080D73D8|nr:uncharacterized protein I203_07463 [Kwoniella mangroviensis CBS 8507]OCF63395.1 hypothetical protein I203_07463 [Kwoniella mangroviensis CBS 8507]